MNDLDHLILSKSGFIFDSRSGDAYQSNEVANVMIKLLQSKSSIDDIAKTLAELYSLDQGQALIDVLEFQNHLSIIGLLK